MTKQLGETTRKNNSARNERRLLGRAIDRHQAELAAWMARGGYDAGPPPELHGNDSTAVVRTDDGHEIIFPLRAMSNAVGTDRESANNDDSVNAERDWRTRTGKSTAGPPRGPENAEPPVGNRGAQGIPKKWAKSLAATCPGYFSRLRAQAKIRAAKISALFSRSAATPKSPLQRIRFADSAPPAPGIVARRYKAIGKNTLIASADLEIAAWHLRIRGVMLHEKNGKRWIQLPSREWLGPGGKPQYAIMVEFLDEAVKDRFQAAALAAFDAIAPRRP